MIAFENLVGDKFTLGFDIVCGTAERPEPPRRSLFLRLVKLCMVLILLAAGAGLAAYFYTPTRPYVAAYVGDFKNRLFPPATVIKPDQSELTVGTDDS